MGAIGTFWRQRTYEKLDGPPPSVMSQARAIRLGTKRSWKKVFRVRVRMSLAKKFVMRLRDAYVEAMLVLAGGIPPPARRRIPRAREVGMKRRRRRRRGSEFERRVVLHAYNVLVAAPPQLLSNLR